MRICILQLLIFSVLFIIIYRDNSIAYDNTFTHRYINEQVVKERTLVDIVLKNSLGFDKGIYTKIDGKEIWKWIRDGGFEEDEPNWRCLRHFHDPLKNWSDAGLFSQYESMIYWAQTPESSNSYALYNEYSWQLAKEYYLQALLTGSEKDYAKTFRAIGQLMHLVSDAALPAHVRYDSHLKLEPFGLIIYDDSDPYEEWVKNNKNIVINMNYDDITVDRIIFDMAVSDGEATSPISALWDHDEYRADGSNIPDGLNNTIGLAEYTNANFWTEDTDEDYPHPRLDETNYYDGDVWLNPEAVDAEDGEIDKRIYFSKTTGDPVEHFVAAGYWYYQLYMWNKPEVLRTVLLDEQCFEDYAEKLIPRAIGYSAALLDYFFFRGSIEITLPAEQHHAGAYAMTTDPDQGFTRITLNAQNNSTSGEKMTDGSIELVVKYKLALDDPFQSYPVPTTEEFFYIAAPEANNIRAIPSDGYEMLEFNLSPAIPLYATDVSINLVYKGILGLEADAVVVGHKDISEPTPKDICSNLDKVCIAGSWHDAGSPEAIALVDTSGNGISDRNEVDVYPHDLRDIYLRASSVADPQDPSRTEDDIHIPEIQAGEFIRAAFILSDDEFMLATYRPLSICIHPDDDHLGVGAQTNIFARTSIKNQTDAGTPEDCISIGTEPPCTIRHYPTFTPFRGVEIRDGIVITYQDGSWGHDISCPLDKLE